MVPFLNSEHSSGQQGLSNIWTQNHPLPQGRPNRNCQICGDMASGFNLNVPRYISEVLTTIRKPGIEKFFHEGNRTLGFTKRTVEYWNPSLNCLKKFIIGFFCQDRADFYTRLIFIFLYKNCDVSNPINEKFLLYAPSYVLTFYGHNSDCFVSTVWT